MKFTTASAAAFFVGSTMTSAFNPVHKAARTKVSQESTKDKSIFSPPKTLDGSMAGDYQFDPLGFASNEQDLELYRRAEIRHARLAMLAAIGWPLSEIYQPKIAEALGQQSLIPPSNLAPAVLNGSISDVNPLFFIGALLFGSMIESATLNREKKGLYEPEFIGDLGFDPLNFYPDEPDLQRQIQAAEINNGRVAMLAITSFAFQEFTNNVGVVEATPQFF